MGMRVAGDSTGLAEAYPDAVVVSGVSKAFGETQALSSCSFTAHGGEIHALVGENGSGKSTLAKMLSGVFSPDSGDVTILGGSPSSPLLARRLGLAMVFQEILVADGSTVLDNLYLGHDGLFRAKASWRKKRAEAQELMDRLTGTRIDLMSDVEDHPLSIRQWIVIARALLGSPRVVVFDEATAALDQASVVRFFQEMKQLKEDGVCVVVVSHRIHELTSFSDRTTVLRDGVNVGTLQGAEITESRLLRLMSGGERVEAEARRAAAQADVHSRASKGEQELLQVSGVQLAAQTQPIDIAVRPGEILGLAGLEGQGQAEFLRTVCGIEKAIRGEVRVNRADGRRVVDSEASAKRAGLAYIPGDRKLEGMFPNLSILENFGMHLYRGLKRAGFIDSGQVHRKYQQQVEDLSIRAGRSGASINSLSGGNQQKIVIGRSLATAPLVVALNDPTRGVDIATKHDLYDLLRKLAKEGRAIIFLSNEIEEFPGLCDRVTVFRNGSIFTILTGSDIDEPHLLAALFGRLVPPEPARSEESVQ